MFVYCKWSCIFCYFLGDVIYSIDFIFIGVNYFGIFSIGDLFVVFSLFGFYLG